MYSFIKKTAAGIVSAIFLMVPTLVLAQPTAIVPDCGVDCGWTDLLTLAGNILKFLIYIAVPVAAIAFMYAGWLYLSARGNPGQITKAHGIFLNVAIGLVIVLVAWLVVDLILKGLLKEEVYNAVRDITDSAN